MSGRSVRFASNALLVAASLGLGYALVAFGGPVVARATMRPYEGRDAIDRQKDGVARIPSTQALEELERLEVADAASIARASELVAGGMVHYWPAPNRRDEELECRFLEHPELWFRIKWMDLTSGEAAELGRLRRLERRDWRTALLLGVGYCSQQAIVLAGYLQERGIEAVPMGLDGHVVTVARTPSGEWVLDPDYGVVIPHSLDDLEARPELVREHYGAIGTSEDRLAQLAEIYGEKGNAEHVGGDIGKLAIRDEDARRDALWGGLAALAGGLWLRRLSRKPQQASREAALHHDAA